MKSVDSLAVKYRPKTIDDVIGQEEAKAMIKNQARKGRLSNAYLISGPNGVGKTTLARIIAHVSNCDEFDKENCLPCWKCDYCVSVLDRRYPGTFELDFSKENKETIKMIHRATDFAPMLCNTQVFILDELQGLSMQGLESLNKQLEEIPSNNVYVLCTSDVEKIPPALRYRCCHLKLNPVNDKSLRDHLDEICRRESLQLSQAAIDVVLEKSQGHVRESLAAIELLIATIDDSEILQELGYDETRTILGLAGTKNGSCSISLVSELLLKGIYKGDGLRAIQAYQTLADSFTGGAQDTLRLITDHHLVASKVLLDTDHRYLDRATRRTLEWSKVVRSDQEKNSLKLSIQSASGISQHLLATMFSLRGTTNSSDTSAIFLSGILAATRVVVDDDFSSSGIMPFSRKVQPFEPQPN